MVVRWSAVDQVLMLKLLFRLLLLFLTFIITIYIDITFITILLSSLIFLAFHIVRCYIRVY